MAEEAKKDEQENKDQVDTDTNKGSGQPSEEQEKEIVIQTDDEQTALEVDYKNKYTELLLSTKLEESPTMQALDLPKELAMTYFKKFFTVSEQKGKVMVTATYEDSKLVNKEGVPVSVDDAVKFIVSKSKDLTSKATTAKKTPAYKGSLKIASAKISDMSLTEKLAYRKQVGPSAYRAILAKQ